MGNNLRTESPDNDSAFSDNLSMYSSESSASSGGSGIRTSSTPSSSQGKAGSLSSDGSLNNINQSNKRATSPLKVRFCFVHLLKNFQATLF